MLGGPIIRALGLAVVGIASLAAPAQAAFPGTNGKIAFMSDRDGNREIYTMNADGTGQTNISNNPADDYAPAWSADGKKLAFVSLRPGDGKIQIYTMNADGSAQTKVTNNPNWFHNNPSWSPSGAQIAMQVTLDSCCAPDLFTINADGTNEQRLTNNSTIDADPAWSPDGSKIAFSSLRDGNPEIYVMSPDGSGVTRLTNDPADDHAPNWSATGDTIAFTKRLCAPVCDDEIYTMPASGGTATDITNNAASDDRDAAFSPANNLIAFTRGAPTSGEIWTMTTTGSTPTQRSSNAAVDEYPDWQPAILGYPRPKTASPIRASLVPAYHPCSTPNRTHGPPLAFDSCNPPTQTSPNLRLGTPDANGAAANSVGWLRMTAIVGVPGPPDDSDLLVRMSLTDVRCGAGVVTCGSANANGGADYTGELRLELDMRLTDKSNGESPSGGIDPATVTDFPLEFMMSCAATASTAEGSSCQLDSSVDNRYPGSMRDGKRAVWEVAQAKVFDGGTDGDADTTADNTLFEIQGLFVP